MLTPHIKKSTVKQSNADEYTSSLVEYSRLVSVDRRFLNHAREELQIFDHDLDPGATTTIAAHGDGPSRR